LIQEILSTLGSVSVPILIPVVGGVLLARFRQLNTGPLLTVVLYILTPAIIFTNLVSAEITAEDLVSVSLFTVSNLMFLWLTAKLLSRALRLSEPESAGLTLVSTISNSVNYGLPLVLFAFGQAGLEKATVYVVLMIIIVNTFGIYLAARSHFSARDAVKSVFSLPAIYAVLAALIVRWTGIQLPEGIDTGISLLAAAYSPIVLIVLGTQMMRIEPSAISSEGKRSFWTGMAVRTLLAPLVAILICFILGIDGLLRAVLVVEASMPVAVTAVILADRFHAAVRTVSLSILWSTLLSFLILPVLIVLVARYSGV